MFGVNDIKKIIYSNKNYTKYIILVIRILLIIYIGVNIGLIKSETANILSFNYKNRFWRNRTFSFILFWGINELCYYYNHIFINILCYL